MQWFANLKIRVKLLSGFVLVALIAGIIGVVGYINIHKIDDADTLLYEKVTVPLGYLADMSISFQRVRINLRDAVTAKNSEESKAAWETVAQLRQRIAEKADKFEKTILTEEGKRLFAEFRQSRDTYLGYIDKIKELEAANKKEEALDLVHGDAKKAALHEQELLNKLMESKELQGKKTSDNNTIVANQAGYLMLAFTVVGVLLAIGLGVFIASMITGPVMQLSDDATKIAAGDLTVQVVCSATDEIGHLAGSFRTMTESLRSTIRQVADTSTSVTTAANQLQATAEQIATGAEEVVAQAQTVATAGEEMAATANDIANNCQSAASGAMDASSSASDGSVVVDKTVQAMGQIARRVQATATTVTSLGERSDQIGQIVGTIEDIADQTNLLALNAAIEAARAGEMGRGFAVVADEVRALAERTTKATKEISDMIRTIQGETRGAVVAMEEGVHEVEQGTSEAAKSGQALQSIMEQVNMVSMQISQVATAAEEQTATTSEISNNMQQITDVIQQTARGAHESAIAATQLSKMAVDLQVLVQRFRL